MGEVATDLVASGAVSISEYIAHEVVGLDSVSEAIEITLDQRRKLGPAQIIVA